MQDLHKHKLVQLSSFAPGIPLSTNTSTITTDQPHRCSLHAQGQTRQFTIISFTAEHVSMHGLDWSNTGKQVKVDDGLIRVVKSPAGVCRQDREVQTRFKLSFSDVSPAVPWLQSHIILSDIKFFSIQDGGKKQCLEHAHKKSTLALNWNWTKLRKKPFLYLRCSIRPC